MNLANLKNLNLNFLITLDVLLEECHASNAAKRLGLTQSAVSFALAKCRDCFNDELLIRTGRGMAPTPMGLQLKPKIRTILNNIESELITKKVLNPMTLSRNFVISMSDITQHALLPKILKKIEKVAPNVTLTIYYERSLNDVRSYTNDNIDIYISLSTIDSPMIESKSLFTSKPVCVVSKKYKDLVTPLTLKKYLAWNHISLNYNLEYHKSLVDIHLAKIDKKRSVVITLPSMHTALQFVKDNKLMVVCDKYLAQQYESKLGLHLVKPPFPLPSREVNLLWHKKFNDDTEHEWFRELISSVV